MSCPGCLYIGGRQKSPNVTRSPLANVATFCVQRVDDTVSNEAQVSHGNKFWESPVRCPVTAQYQKSATPNVDRLEQCGDSS